MGTPGDDQAGLPTGPGESRRKSQARVHQRLAPRGVDCSAAVKGGGRQGDFGVRGDRNGSTGMASREGSPGADLQDGHGVPPKTSDGYGRH